MKDDLNEEREAELGDRPRGAVARDGGTRTRSGKRRGPWPLLGVVGAILLAMWGAWRWTTSAPSTTHQAVVVTIRRGTGTLGIGRLLKSQGLVRNAYAFLIEAKLQGVGNVRAGRYRLYEDMGLTEVLATLAKGPRGTGQLSFTIPEGYTLRQMADMLQAKGITDGKEFRRLATDPAEIARLGEQFPFIKDAGSKDTGPKDTGSKDTGPKDLEGYLFPDTYELPAHTPASRVLETLLTNFGNRFARPYQQEIGTAPHSLHEIVTIASLIEREAEIDVDRARIAGVIENRLARHQKLQIDATVIYALGHHKNHVSYKDLKVESPYNTYAHVGLPPGAIASPGLPSLIAALRPEKHDFLYYVAGTNRAHIFTRTETEHFAAVKRIQAERIRAERKAEAKSP